MQIIKMFMKFRKQIRSLLKEYLIQLKEDNKDVHADPNKAKGVAGLFKNENVKVVVSKIFD